MLTSSSKVLIIQTAFVGDVILSTALVESLWDALPGISVHYLVRKGNEGILANNQKIKKVITVRKSKKTKKLPELIIQIRKEKYDAVINVHRFAFSGLLTLLSGAKIRVGFAKNPLSIFYSMRVEHIISKPNDKKIWHEIERNFSLITQLGKFELKKPKLYPSASDYEFVSSFQTEPYIVIAPSSVWKTKRLPRPRWQELLTKHLSQKKVYLIGSADDKEFCQSIINNSGHENCENLAGKLSFLQSASLMQSAIVNLVNDSGPLHIASAMNANVKAFFLSTIPEFGFGPLSDNAEILQTKRNLSCRPCGIHGKTACPEGHFNCSDIKLSGLI